MAPALQGMSLADLKAADVAFLVAATGIADPNLESLVAAFARAGSAAGQRDRAGAELPPLPVAAWYAWHRQGLALDPAALWEHSTDQLLGTLRSAVDAAVIPAQVRDDLDSIGATIERFKFDLAFAAPAPDTASFGEILGILPAPLDLDQQRAMVRAVSESHPDDSSLVERIPGVTGFDVDPASVARTLRLRALTSGHLPMAQALQSRLQLAEDTEGSLRPLTALQPDEWLDLAYTHGTPDGVTITPIAYADAMAATVEKQYPTAALAAHLAGGRRLAQQPLLEEVGAFLQNNPTFDIVTVDVSALGEQATIDGIADAERLAAGLRTLQRMNTLDATWEETASLLESGISSPHQTGAVSGRGPRDAGRGDQPNSRRVLDESLKTGSRADERDHDLAERPGPGELPTLIVFGLRRPPRGVP